MKWEEDARQVVDAIPVHDIIKNMIILWAERCARKDKRDIVTPEDMIKTRDDYFEWFGEAKIAKIQQARDQDSLILTLTRRLRSTKTRPSIKLSSAIHGFSAVTGT